MSTKTQLSPREMLVNMCHFGHKTANWNPKMKKYLYGTKNGVHVFDLGMSIKALAELLNKIAELSSEGKTILFVSTKPQTQELLKNIHETTGMPIVSFKWLGGLLTNFSTIKQRISLMRSLQSQFETGEIEKYTKKEQSQYKKLHAKLEQSLGGLEGMNKVPDAVFVVDGKRDKIAIEEANKLNIPVIGIADSNVDPDGYTIAVPSNDDSLKALELILGLVEEAIMNNKGKKATSAEKKEEEKTNKPAGGVEKMKK